MEKTFLEKKIRENAEVRTEREYSDFISFIYKNKFGKDLKIKIGEELIPIAEYGSNYSLFNGLKEKNSRSTFTNLKDVYDKILQRNIEVATEELLSKLENISYLFD